MSHFLVRLFFADLLILSIQSALLLLHQYQHEKRSANYDFIINVIFTIKDDVILFLNPPFFILLYYAIFFIKNNVKYFKFNFFILATLNIIILYYISWIGMLLLMAIDVRV